MLRYTRKGCRETVLVFQQKKKRSRGTIPVLPREE
jgi:hypothetical protein